MYLICNRVLRDTDIFAQFSSRTTTSKREKEQKLHMMECTLMRRLSVMCRGCGRPDWNIAKSALFFCLYAKLVHDERDNKFVLTINLPSYGIKKFSY